MAHPVTERMHALDTIRGAALMLGIFFHATFSFFPGDTFWIIMDNERSVALSVTAFTLHIFRMVTFFVLAGFFGHLQFHRLGGKVFIKDRLKRLGIPLVVSWLIAMMAFTGLIVWALIVQNGGTLPEDLPPPPGITLEAFPLTYLWFLYVLLILYIAMIAVRTLVAKLDRNQSARRLLDGALIVLQKTHILPLVLAVPTALALYYHKDWYPWFGIPTPEYGFLPNLASLIAYGSAFAFGWVLHRQRDLISKFETTWLPYLVAATGLTIFCLYLVGTVPYYTTSLQGTEKITYVAAYALAIWCWTFAFIGLALRFFSGHSKISRYLADSSYWLYLIHLPIVMALQILMSQWALPAMVKYVFILGVSLPVMLASYHYLVRFSFIGALLNGRKKKKGREEYGN